jgi:hypothetical protein
MAALFQEGCKQQPGHSSDMMRAFSINSFGLPARFEFERPALGSLLMFGRYRTRDSITPANLAAIGKLLDERGLLPADELDNRLQKAPGWAVG